MTIHNGSLLSGVVHSKGAIAPDWTDSFVYNNSSDGWRGSLNQSGTLSDTQPINEPIRAKSGAELPGFVDDFYNRILIEPGVFNLGSLVSDQFRVVSVFNGYFATKTLEALSISNGDGLSLVGPTPPSDWLPLETKTYQLSILQEGPPSIDADIFFDWAGTVDDRIIPVTGVRVVMLPIQAAAPFNEILEWKTNVITSNDGSEQRIRLRKAPRQSFQAKYPVSQQNMALVVNTVYGWLQRTWAVAVWSQAQLGGQVVSGDTTIYCDTTKYEFRAGGLAGLWESSSHHEVVEVADIFPDRVTLKRGTTNSYSAPQIFPVRMARVVGNVSRSTNGHTAEIGLRYEVLDNQDLGPSAPDQFLGEDIYFDEALLEITDQFSTRVDVVDYETGKLDFYAPWRYNRITRPYRSVQTTPEEAWAFKQWLHRRAGRQRPFWQPTFEQDLRLNMTGLVTANLLIYSDGYLSLGSDHNHVAIQLTNGNWAPRTITGISVVDANTLSVALDSPLNVDASEILRVSFLALKRLEADRVELSWVGNGVCTSTIRVTEIKP